MRCGRVAASVTEAPSALPAPRRLDESDSMKGSDRLIPAELRKKRRRVRLEEDIECVESLLQ
jgi:hypothetical protein